jgi:hypothetical protein
VVTTATPETRLRSRGLRTCSVGLIARQYILNDFLGQVHCVNAGYSPSAGTLRVTLEIRNSVGLVTKTPVVELRI